jgi:hypothetical protein
MPGMAKSVASILGQMCDPQRHSGEGRIGITDLGNGGHQADGQGESWAAQLDSSEADKQCQLETGNLDTCEGQPGVFGDRAVSHGRNDIDITRQRPGVNLTRGYSCE